MLERLDHATVDELDLVVEDQLRYWSAEDISAAEEWYGSADHAPEARAEVTNTIEEFARVWPKLDHAALDDILP